MVNPVAALWRKLGGGSRKKKNKKGSLRGSSARSATDASSIPQSVRIKRDDLDGSMSASVATGRSIRSTTSSQRRGARENFADALMRNSQRHSTQEDPETLARLAKNAKGLANYFAAVNEHKSVEELLDCFSSPDTKIMFEEDPTLTAKEISGFYHVMFDSFPDFTMNLSGSTKEISPHKMVVDDLVVTVTHTGKPFALPSLPPVEAKGVRVVLDPERFIIDLDENGRISELRVISLGSNTGPMGLYLGIGGKLG